MVVPILLHGVIIKIIIIRVNVMFPFLFYEVKEAYWGKGNAATIYCGCERYVAIISVIITYNFG
jgi:hypothetical protein